MSACPTLNYQNVSQDAWDKIKAVVAEEHLSTITSDTGSATDNGFTLAWVYVAGILTITCTDSPWWAPCDKINATIDGIVKPLLA